MDRRTIERWKRAVVHIETRVYRGRPVDIETLAQAARDHQAGKIADEQIAGMMAREMDYDRGTAILVHDRGRRYLVTAAHVVMRGEQVAHVIIRVPRVTERRLDSGRIDPVLHHMTVGAPAVSRCTIDAGEDVAVFTLDEGHSPFVDMLTMRGHEPIPGYAIASGPSMEGAPLFTVGYPGPVSRIEDVHDDAEERWAEPMVRSMPALSFGHVSMIRPDSDRFWANIAVTGGNSGGPLIEDDSLVGLVCKHANAPIEESVDDIKWMSVEHSYGLPFTEAIGGAAILRAIETQRTKDELKASRFSRPVSVHPR